MITIVVALFFAMWAAILTLVLLASLWILPEFGEVTLWQVLAYVGEPISLLSDELQRQARLCYMLSGAVLVFVFGVYLLLSRWFRSRFRVRGLVVLNASFLIFSMEATYAVYMYLDGLLGITYEIRCRMMPSSLLKDEFRWVDPDAVTFGARRRNLLVLVGESIEDSYVDGRAYGVNLMPRLGDWRSRHDRFGTMESVHGTDHTICSLFGMVYGSPRLQTDGVPRSVSFSHYPESVMPNAWRIWLNNGFACRFVQGGEIAFACTDKVFRAVPGVVVHDKAHFEADPDYLKESRPNRFGVNDAVVIGKHLRGETEELARQGKPFVMIVWTLDTHCSGWASELQARRHPDTLAHAIMQTDDLLSDYLAWFERQPFAAETAVVVIGDHVGHTSFDSLPKNMRHPYNALSVPGLKGVPLHRSFASFDLAPTFLELTGARLPDGRFGLGTSLLREQPTLLERIGRKRYEDEIRACGIDYRRIAFGW